MSNALDFSKKRTILVVDDTPENLMVIGGLLRPEYLVKAAPSGARALQIAAETPPDLILLDIMMPEMDGYEVLSRLQANPATAPVPVIFVTAKDQENDEKNGLELGAVDYITKPVSPPILLARVRNHLLLKEARDFLKDETTFLRQQVTATQNGALHAFSALAAMRDDETEQHVRRMWHYVRVLAKDVATQPAYRDSLDERTIDLILRSVPLHDIGKVGIPDDALLGGADLGGTDGPAMQRHAMIGCDAIERAEYLLGADGDFLKYAKEITSAHHERWDGSGYPLGLSGTKIPLSARMTAVADLYDQLVSCRPQKPPMPHEEAVEIMRAARGSRLDPDLVDAFLRVHQEFADIASRFADSESDVAEHVARLREGE